MGDHIVELYATDAHLARTVARFLLPAFATGEGALVVATPAHRTSIALALQGAGVDMRCALTTGQFVEADAADLLAGFTVGGEIVVDRFHDRVGAMLDAVSAGRTRRVRVFGEMVAVLCDEGDVEGAAALEALWNELRAERHDFSLLCGYRRGVAEHVHALVDEPHDRVTVESRV